MLRDRVAGIRQTMMYAPRYYRRFISSVLIDDQHSADSITARANFLVIETLVDEPSRVAFCGVSHDKLRLADSRWRNLRHPRHMHPRLGTAV